MAEKLPLHEEGSSLLNERQESISKGSVEEGGRLWETIEKDCDKISKLLGLDLKLTREKDPITPKADHLVVPTKPGLGLQGRSYILKGTRWKEVLQFEAQAAVAKEAALTAEEERNQESAFVKIALEGSGSRESRVSGVKCERQFLRAWAAAEKAGEISLPPDSLLVIPRLFDSLATFGGDEAAARCEELFPSLLIMEDLCARGFKPNPISGDVSLSEEDANTIACALADFHTALWRIRDRLYSSGAILIPPGRESAPEPLKYEGASTDLEMMIWFREKVGGLYDFLRDNLGTRFQNLDKSDPLYLHSLMKRARSDMIESYTDRNCAPLLLIHGDAYPPNLMLRRDSTGKITGVALVDLGSCVPGHPGRDVFGFLTLSVRASLWNVKHEFVDGKTRLLPGVYGEHCANTRVRDMYANRLYKYLPKDAGIFTEPEKCPRLNVFSVRSMAHAETHALSYCFNWTKWFVGDEELKQRYMRLIRMAVAYSMKSRSERRFAFAAERGDSPTTPTFDMDIDLNDLSKNGQKAVQQGPQDLPVQSSLSDGVPPIIRKRK